MNEPFLSGIVYISPRELVVHPKLIEIYGEQESRPDLEEDMSKRGVIINALIVSSRRQENVILSGKCRYQVALKLGWSEVPIKYIECSSLEDEEAWVLALNYNRESKTNYQKLVEGEHWEHHFKPLAKKNNQVSADYARKFLIRSNSTESEVDSELNIKHINVRDEVAKKLKLGAGPYSNSKQVYKKILLLKEEEKFIAATALEKELNRSIDAAYKFVCDKDTYNQVIDLIESGQISSVGDGVAWVRNGERNPFRKFKLGDIYIFNEEARLQNCSLAGRVVDITNEFVVFGFRNMSNWHLQTVRFRPRNIRAQKKDEGKNEQRPRINSLMEKYFDIAPVMIALDTLLKFPDLTHKEEAYLRMLERNYDTNIRLVEEELGIVEACGNKNTDILRAA